jgi:putative spermidine/putrescine transport system permease protein
MATLTRANRSARRVSTSSTVWLLLAAAYFLIPLFATAAFSLKDGDGHSFDAYQEILSDPQFRETLWVSLRLAFETVAISLLLFVPTVYWLYLHLPQARRVIEFITLLPLVVPPVVLIVGLLNSYGEWPATIVGRPEFLVGGYVVLSFPFMYRALDAGFRSVDVRTLNEAAVSLGASRGRALLQVILPNIRTAALSGSLLTFAVVMGEFTMANIALFNTFPVYITYIGETKATPAAALSLLSFAITWIAMLGVLAIGWRRGRATEKRVALAQITS